MTWKDYAAIAGPAIAVVALFYSHYANRIARKSLNTARKTAQTSYEDFAASRKPSANIFLEEIEYRKCSRKIPAGEERRRFQAEFDPASLEVVIRGRIVNNLDQEVLLTCRDHPKSGRDSWRSLWNESVFFVDGREIELSDAVLPAGRGVSFMWIDRRSRGDWINIQNVCYGRYWGNPEGDLPRLSWLEAAGSLLRMEGLVEARRKRVGTCGFEVICEPRTTERVATVWRAEVRDFPVRVSGRDANDRVTFEDRIAVVSGPLDDETVYYRARFDSTLALIEVPKMRYLAGRRM